MKKSHFLPILKYLLGLPKTCRTNFHFEVAIDYLDAEVMQILSQMPKGRVQLEIGIQSTNEITLQAVSRLNHWTKIAEHIKKIMSFHNMHLHVDLIIGLPGEGMASFAKSFNDVYALQTDMLQLGFLKFLKGTKSDFCLVFSVALYVFFVDSATFRDIRYIFHLAIASNLYIRFHTVTPYSFL